MRFKLTLIFTFLVSSFAFAQAGNPVRVTYNFNPGWKLYVGDAAGAASTGFNDKDWKAITLPHAWNEDEAFKKSIEELSTGISWYRKHFKIPVTDAGKKIFLEFEGIRQAGEFYLNGKFIGQHENGITAFGFDITEFLKPNGEENVLAIRIDNAWDYKEKATGSRYQWNDRNFNANYGGLSKNVLLHATGKLYQTLPLFTTLKTTGNYIYARNFNIPNRSATVVAESEIKNEDSTMQNVQYEVEIRDVNNKLVKVFTGNPEVIKPGEIKTFIARAELSNLNFWSWGYGYLYSVITRLKLAGNVVDEVTTKTGFRKAEFKNGMVYLNDRVLMIHGYAQRSSNEWPAIGLSVPAWISDYSNKLMLESNANLVRWMHITPWKQDVESCDRVGLLQAMPAGDSEQDITGVRWEQRKSVMKDAIIYNRNNPSIVFYECGNESISQEHMEEMKAIRDQYDPNGYRAIGSREMLDIDQAEYGGEMLYINKSANKPLWSMEYSRDEGLRKYWDEFSPPFHKNGAGPLYKGADASEYNRNQDSHAIENIARWNDYYRERPGTGTRVSSGGVNIIFSDSNTHHRGEENYRRSGEVDAMRIPKDGFYAHKVMWDGWVEPKKTGIHLIGHWNYKPGVQKDVFAVSTGNKVELFLNGQSLGYGQLSDGFLFTFKNISWKPGILKAISYNNEGKKLAETELKTAGAPAALRLTAIKNPAGFKADGADAALIEVEVTDKDGNRCPTALNLVGFKLSGPAEWRGGIAQGPDNYILSKDLPVEGGVNRVIIRSTTTPGKIELTAHADGLKPASIALQTSAFKVEDGLSTILPAFGLKPDLSRGATPSGPSYTVTRKTIRIVAAESGANTDKAKLSYDDNELSGWTNDGKNSTAWIKYTLDKESTVTGIDLKLNGFRSKTYPIRILVDDKEVFNDNTKPGLGYFAAIFKPAKGKTVTIQLSNKSADQNNGNFSVEMNGKKLDDGIKMKGAETKGTFSIIEADIFENP